MIRQPATQSAARSNVKTVKLPPPARWNAVDGLSQMSSTDAIRLDNWIIRGKGRERHLVLRPGSIRHLSGLGGKVQTLMVYGRRRHSQTIIAATPTKLYRVPSSPASAADPQTADVTGLTSGFWQSAMITNPGGDFLLAVNGADALRCYDGRSWTTPTITSAIATRSVAATAFVDVCAHMGRAFFAEKNSLRIWYLEPGAIGGTAWPIDLAPMVQSGGEIQAIASLTTDGGRNGNDRLVAVTTQGEMVVFAGVHPGTAATWQRVATYSVPVPVARRCFMEHGGDLLYLSHDGLLPVSQMIAAPRPDQPLSAETDDIRSMYQTARVLGTGNAQWCAISSSTHRLYMINVPISANGSVQLVRSSDGGWSAFSGLNSLCWASTGTDLYYGDADGNVFRLGGTQDDGGQITALMVQAYSDFGVRGRKIFKRARPIFGQHVSMVASLSLAKNYAPIINSMLQPLDASGAVLLENGSAIGLESGGVLLLEGGGNAVELAYEDQWAGAPWSWDEMDWPLTPALWTKDIRSQVDHWRGISGHGHAAALIMAVTAKEPVTYEGCEIAFETGGQI